MIGNTLLRIALGMDPSHRYSRRYLEAKDKRIKASIAADPDVVARSIVNGQRKPRKP